MSINFDNQDVNFVLNKTRILKKWIKRLAKFYSRNIFILNYIFCSDQFILDLNNKFLHHNYFTDVITFDLGDAQNPEIYGEIYISIDTVADNATTYQTTFDDELFRVMAHGLLHLIGYDDVTDEQIAVMREKENEALILLRKLYKYHFI